MYWKTLFFFFIGNWKTLLKNTWEFIKYWEIQKETIFQKLFTYHLPSTSSLLESKDLSGVSVIVTGSTSGVGLNTAKQLAMAGAHVIMACRNINAANKIASMWREEVHNSRMPNVEVMELDLVSISSVRRFADEWEQRGEPLDILINNAGILNIEDEQRFTGDGIEQHMQVNHVAPALLTLLLLPSLLKAPSPRIINVSSVAHYSGVVEPQYWNSRIEEGKYNSMIAYGSSKLAHIMFLKVLASKLLDQWQTSVPCFAVHPGAVCTNLNDGARMNLFIMFDGTEGARSVILCATSDSVTNNLVKGFAYYSCTCEPGKLSPKAEDMDFCFEIWRKTVDILDMKDDYLTQLLDNHSN